MAVFGKSQTFAKSLSIYGAITLQVRRNLPKFDKKAFDLNKWRLHVDGLVKKPLSLKYDDIGRFPNVSLTQDFRCLEGWIVRDIVWQGVRVSSILELAELKTEATSVLFSSGDYSTVIPVNKALEGSTILALGMRGKVLNSYHGGPVRLVFHAQECYDSVKFVNRIQVLASHVEGTAKGIALARLAKQS